MSLVIVLTPELNKSGRFVGMSPSPSALAYIINLKSLKYIFFIFKVLDTLFSRGSTQYVFSGEKKSVCKTIYFFINVVPIKTLFAYFYFNIC